MKAVVYTKYGLPDVLEFKDVEKPSPRAGELLIRMHASSVNAKDWHLLTADIFLVRANMGLLKPKIAILGGDIAGRVEAIGEGITKFNIGDAVFGLINAGGFAEYVCVKEDDIVLKPANLSFEEAAAVPLAAITALQALRDHAGVQRGQKVLINGASGGVGTFAIQIAKWLGAEVTAVCSTGKLDQARTLGADHVIDYTKEDFTTKNERYDVILAVNGYHSLSDYKRALTPQGLYLMAGGTPSQIFESVLTGKFRSSAGGQRVKVADTHANQSDLLTLKALCEAGTLRPVIDRSYTLQETAEAMRELGAGHARGKIVIAIHTDSPTA